MWRNVFLGERQATLPFPKSRATASPTFQDPLSTPIRFDLERSISVHVWGRGVFLVASHALRSKGTGRRCSRGGDPVVVIIIAAHAWKRHGHGADATCKSRKSSRQTFTACRGDVTSRVKHFK